MSSAHRPLLLPALLLATVLASCAEDLTISEKARITCTTECPEGWTCNARLGRCIRNDALDTVPPSIVGPVTVEPPEAPLGSVVRVAFDVNEPLSVPPVVTIDLGTGVPKSLTLDASASSGTHWAYAWTTVGDEPQGRACPITIALEDLQGLPATGLSGGNVRFDFLPPSLSGVQLEGSPVGSLGTVRVRFRASEPPVADPVVRLGSAADFVKSDALSSGLDYVYEYLSDGTEPQGAPGFPVTVDLADVAGNAATGLALGTAIFDRMAPSLVAAPTVTPLDAAEGALVRVTFELDEELAADPIVRLGSIPLDKGLQVGRRWSYSHVAAPGDEGSWPLTIEVADLAGNGATLVPGEQVTFDFSTPTVAELRVCLDDGTADPCAGERSTFSAAPGGDGVKVSFTLSEPAERLDVTVGALSLVAGGSCTGAGLARVCTHVVTDPAGGTSPRVETDTVAIAAIDAAGNSSFDYRWITYDFRPASVAGSPYFERCDGYLPARVASNDLWVKGVGAFAGPACPFASCGLSGPVRVHFSVDENVTPVGTGVSLDDGTPLAIDTCASSGTQIVAVLTSDGTTGVRTVRAEVQDAGGNTSVLPLGTLRLDRAAPAAPDTATAGRVLYERFPWGSTSTGGVRSYYLRGGAGAVAAGASVVALDGSVRATASEIGRATADGAGAFGGLAGSASAFEVVSANLPEIYVAQEDAAGNSSPASPVWDGTWTATLGGKQRGNTFTNPNVLYEQPLWRAFRDTTAQREPADPAAIAAGTALLTTVGQPGFSREWTLDGIPYQRGGCAMAWDPARAQGVLFGGFWNVYASAPVLSDETWIWNGRSWVAVAPPVRPQGRWGHGLAQDKARDRTVLFGGCTEGAGSCTAVAGDTWEFDGESWRRVCWPGCSAPSECSCTQSPPARSDAALFWDAVNGELLLFGGSTPSGPLGDMWAWDGRSWSPRVPAHLPAAGTGAMSATDPVTGTALVVGPLAVWSWDGADWTQFTTTETPFGQLWFDETARRFRAHFTPSNRLLEWSGSDWVALANPAVVGDTAVLGASRYRACGAWDSERAAWIRFGGCVDDFCRADYSAQNLTFAFRAQPAGGNAFVQLFPGNSPYARLAPGMAWSPSTQTAWLFGGKSTTRYSYEDDWQWNGLGWLGTRVAAGSGGADSQAMCRLGADRLVRFGGQGYGFPGGPPVYTWAWYSGTGSWSFWLGSSSYTYVEPVVAGNMVDQSMAWDEARNEAIFFRGNAAGGATTWSAVWNPTLFPPESGQPSGVDWRPRAPTTWSTSVRGHRLAYCAGAGGMILFGGHDGTSPLAETWSWNGTDWTRLSPAQSPPAREQHVMFCDARRQKIYVVGGTGAAGILADVWEFDGSTWRERMPLERPSARRGAGAAFHEASGRGVLFGGYGTEYLGDTWTWDGGRDARPAQVFRAAFGAAGVWDDAAIQGVDAAFSSGGSGGASLSIWDRGQWRSAAGGNGAPVSAPAPLAWSTGSAAEWSGMTAAQREARLRRLFSGDAREVTFAVAPVATHQTSTTMASVASGAIEVAVRYRLRCRAAGSATADPARCCSGSAAGGICN